MGVIGLAFPTDIRWERVCHTEDMSDTKPCDQAAPPKWQSSIAVYRYVPEEEYQTYEGRRLVYYKVTCTITSYQPQADEVEGAITKAGALTTGEAQALDQKLKSYAPCNGAILQVTVAPQEEGVRRRDYPYVAQVQPNQRALYEQVTDSNEVASRSLEDLNVTKGGGSTRSQEVLDIDKGTSVGGQVSVSGQYAGVGGGIGVGGSYSHSGEWGTKSMGQEGRSRTATTDSLREARETSSHTTQLTQMYNLLQAYHVGTNRVIFYVTPRPHVLEEPSGFIRGPREIDGIQDFFLIVNQDEDQKLPCLSVRLDTGHLTKIDETDYDRSEAPKDLGVNAFAPPPNELAEDKVKVGGDLHYDCYDSKPDIDSDPAVAPTGYVVERVEELVPREVYRGQVDPPTTATVDGDLSYTLIGQATGHACFRNAEGDAANTLALLQIGSSVAGPLGGLVGLGLAAGGEDVVPEQRDVEAGYARARVRVHYRSAARTKKTGERQVLLITTRVLCCCDEPDTPPKIVEIVPVEIDLELARPPGVGGGVASTRPPELAAEDDRRATVEGEGVAIARRSGEGQPGSSAEVAPAAPPGIMTAREANELAAHVVAETARVASSVDNPAEAPARDADLALARVTELALEIPRFRRLLTRPAETIEGLGDAAEKRLTKMPLPDSPAEAAPTRLSVAAAPTPALSQSLRVDESDAVQLRLAALGFGKAPRGAGRSRRRPR